LENWVDLQTKVTDDTKRFMKGMTHHRDCLIKQINEQDDTLCIALQQKRAKLNLELCRSKQLVQDARTSVEKLITKVENWLEPVMGFPELRLN